MYNKGGLISLRSRSCALPAPPQLFLPGWLLPGARKEGFRVPLGPQEREFRTYHPLVRLLAPPPHLLDPFIQERVLPPVPEVDARHQGREEEQEDEQKSY